MLLSFDWIQDLTFFVHFVNSFVIHTHVQQFIHSLLVRYILDCVRSTCQSDSCIVQETLPFYQHQNIWFVVYQVFQPVRHYTTVLQCISNMSEVLLRHKTWLKLETGS